MKRTSSAWMAAFGLLLLAAACEPKDDESGAKAAPKAAAQQTAERLVERCAKRMDLECAGEWIDVYAYISPSIKQYMTIYQFIEGKDNHDYDKPAKPEIVAINGNKGYVQVSVLWTPKHPLLQQVEIPEGESLTERVEMIETWEWIDGDWYMTWPPERPSDFFSAHPELLRQSSESAKGTETAPTANGAKSNG